MQRVCVRRAAVVAALVTCFAIGAGGQEPYDFVVARDAVRELLRPGLTRKLIVLVRGGTYTLTAPVAFDPRDSAPSSHRVTYVAWPGEAPVLFGGRALAGWQPAAGTRWTMQIPDVASGQWFFDQRFTGGLRSPQARHPNSGFLRVAVAGLDDRTSFHFRSGDLRLNDSLLGAEWVFLHDWSISRVAIASVDYGSGNVTRANPIGAGSPFFRISGLEYGRGRRFLLPC